MGMRYAFMGPMETIHLNAEGTQNYCDRYGEVRAKYPICVSMIPNKFMKNANQQFRILTLSFTDNIQCLLGSGSDPHWVETRDREG